MTPPLPDGVVRGDDGVARCFWGTSTPGYQRYHDHEWGRPVADDHRLFEKVCLEAFQSGLSWRTILEKREAFREVFHGFDPEAVARFGEDDVVRLLGDARIVRHRGKIEATIANARAVSSILDEHGSFAAYVWRFEPPPSERPDVFTRAALVAASKTPTSAALAKDLKAHGFRFVGPTTAYAFMQAMGLVNDHLEGCAARDACAAARRAFTPPT